MVGLSGAGVTDGCDSANWADASIRLPPARRHSRAARLDVGRDWLEACEIIVTPCFLKIFFIFAS